MKELTLLIMKALQIEETDIQIKEKMDGMTNLNYLTSIKGKNFIVRFPGRGTEDFINRAEEKDNLEFSSNLGINPQLMYFDVESGFKITEKIQGAKLLVPETAKSKDMMEKVSDLLRKLHHSNHAMKNQFELFSLMEKYEALALREDAQFFEGFHEVKDKVLLLKKYYEALNVKECPCHIDTTFQNFIEDSKDNLYLIDWEYSGMFDPIWDLAAYSLESELSTIEEERLLAFYFQRPITKLEYERINLHKIFQDYLWSLWALFKEAKGDDVGQYGRIRFERAKKHIYRFYKQEATENE